MWDELPQIIRLIAAMAFVIGLMGGLAFLLKKLGLAEKTENKTTLKMGKDLEEIWED